MKWLIAIFMFAAVSMSLISCSKKDDGTTITTGNCYGYNRGGSYPTNGGYPYNNPGYNRGGCTNSGYGGNDICLYDSYEDRIIRVSSCGYNNNGQPFGRTPDGQCIPASYCSQF